jgi:hypothetical protein
MVVGGSHSLEQRRRFIAFALQSTIRKVQEIQMVLKSNETHQLLVYADLNQVSDVK